MKNIYKKYRKMSGMTQERASEHLEISIDSLKRYEMGDRAPNNELVKKMCILYGDTRLAYDHLCNTSAGELFLEKLDEKSLCTATISVINEIKKFNDKYDKIIEITSDGIIDTSEIGEWTEIETQAKKAIKSFYELIFRR